MTSSLVPSPLNLQRLPENGTAPSVNYEIIPIPPSRVLAQMWRDLEARSDAHFFLSWDWIGCWLEHITATPALLVGRVEDRIVLLGALVPAQRREIILLTFPGLHLHTTGTDQDIITIEYNGFLVDRAWAGRVERDAIAFLLSGVTVDGRRRDELHLKNVLQPHFGEFQNSAVYRVELARKPSWRVDLAASRATGKSFLDHLSANTRYQIRRSMRLYERQGKLVATRARDLGEAMRFMDGLKALPHAHWVARGERGAFAYP